MVLVPWISFCLAVMPLPLKAWPVKDVESSSTRASSPSGSRCASVTHIIPNVTVLYVSLERRSDRRQQFESQLEPYFGLLRDCKGWDWQRKVAFDMGNDTEASRILESLQLPKSLRNAKGKDSRWAARIGCYLSHFDGLQEVAARSESRTAFMFEDDFEFTASPAAVWSTLQAFSQEYGDSGWDVLLVGHNQYRGGERPTKIRGITQCLGASATTSSYLVNPRYAPKLVDVWRRHLISDDQPIVDTAWSELQEDTASRWYKVSPRIGWQRAGFSDIEQTYVDYNHPMMVQVVLLTISLVGLLIIFRLVRRWQRRCVRHQE